MSHDRVRGGSMPPAPYVRGAVSPTVARPPLSVLFVDPDTSRSRQLAEQLLPACVVEAVTSARAAAQVVARHIPDLVIVDLDLQDVSAITFIAHLHELPTTRHTLIMVLTQRASVREKIAALAAGADDYVVWPIDPEAFVLRVQLLSRFRRTLQW